MASSSAAQPLTVAVDVHVPHTAAAPPHNKKPAPRKGTAPVVPMTLCAFGFKPLSQDAMTPFPVFSHQQWRRWAAKHGRELHTATVSVSRVASPRTTQGTPHGVDPGQPAAGVISESLSSISSAECVSAVSLFLPQNQHLHFYARTDVDELSWKEAAVQESPSVPQRANKRRKLEMVAYRRAASLAVMDAHSVVRVRFPGEPNQEAAVERDASLTAAKAPCGRRHYVDLRRQLPPVVLASSFARPAALVDAVPDVDDYPIIRAVPLFFHQTQIRSLEDTPITAPGGFRRTWGLKEVNTHAMARRSGSATPPPQSA